MRTHDPKMILNLSFKSEELENKIEIAMEKYINKISEDKLDKFVGKYIDKKLYSLLTDETWRRGTINGMTLEKYIAKKADAKIEEVIDKNIKEIIARKLTAII